MEENAVLIKLKNKINFARRTMEDIDDQPAKSQAERQSKRKEKRTQEVMEKERTIQRVCKVAQQAGGLTEARLPIH